MTIFSCLLLVSFLVPYSFGISPSLQPVIEVFFKLVSKNLAHVIRRNWWNTKCLQLCRIRMKWCIRSGGSLINVKLALKLVALETLVELARIWHPLKPVHFFVFVQSNRCLCYTFSVLLILIEGIYVSTFLLAKVAELSICHSAILVPVEIFEHICYICRCQLNLQGLQAVHEIILRKFASLY